MRIYRQLEEKDRKKLAKLKSYKISISEIARRMGFNKSTISRELKRNGIVEVTNHKECIKMYAAMGCHDLVEFFKSRPPIIRRFSYQRQTAQWRANRRRRESSQRSRVKEQTQSWIKQKLYQGWSPQQIAGRSSKEAPQKVSHEYVYQFIIKDKKQGGGLYRLLKRFGKRKQRLAKRSYKKEIIPGRVSISQRPQFIEKRERLGDLEGDLIVGRKQSGYIITLVDRSSRLLACELIKTKKMSEVEKGILSALSRMHEPKTLTLDNAREFSCHKSITQKTGVQIYFADPYSSYQRGTNENTNGLLRYYFPKKTNFSLISKKKLKSVENLINNRPRKILNYLTPKELAHKKANNNLSVALQS